MHVDNKFISLREDIRSDRVKKAINLLLCQLRSEIHSLSGDINKLSFIDMVLKGNIIVKLTHMMDDNSGSDT